MVAETNCGMKGEINEAKGWVAKFDSGFDTLTHQEDANLFIYRSAQIENRRKQLGTHAWCVEYRARKKLFRQIWR